MLGFVVNGNFYSLGCFYGKNQMICVSILDYPLIPNYVKNVFSYCFRDNLFLFYDTHERQKGYPQQKQNAMMRCFVWKGFNRQQNILFKMYMLQKLG